MENDKGVKNRRFLRAELLVLVCIAGVWAARSGAGGIGSLKAAMLGQIARMSDNDADAYYNLGEAHLGSGRYAEAAKAYNEAIRVSPDFLDAHYRLALAYKNSGRCEEALEVCKRAIRMDPAYADSNFGLGQARVSYLSGFANTATDCTGPRPSAQATDPINHSPGISATSKTEQVSVDVQALRRAARIKDSSEAYYDLGRSYYRIGSYEQAEEAFNTAIGKDANHAEAYISLGVTFERLGRYAEAIRAYEQAVRIRPDDALACRNLGVTYAHLNHRKEAERAYRQAIRIRPDYADVHLLLALNHLIQFDRDSALHEYEILKTLDPHLATKLFDLMRE